MFDLDDLLIDIATVPCFDTIEHFTPDTKVPMTRESFVMFDWGLSYDKCIEFLALGYSPAIYIDECDPCGATCKPVNGYIL